MKLLQFIIFIFLLSLINGDQCDLFTNVPMHVNDCINQTSENQRESEFKEYCCFSKSANHINPTCISLTQIQYDNIKDYIRFNEILWGDVNMTINCNSSYLKYWMLTLIIYILLLNE